MGGGWIVDDCAALGEVAHALGEARDGLDLGGDVAQAEPFVVGKEENLVLLNRAAQGSPKLVLRKVRGVIGFVERARVQDAVADEFINIAVHLVAAGLRDDIDLGAARSAELRRIAAGLDFEFLHSVRRRAERQGIERWVRIRGAVEKKVVGVGPPAADAQGGILLGPPVQRVGGARLGAGARVDARREQRQLQEVPAVERKFFSHLGLDDFAQSGVGGAKHLDTAHHLDGLRQRAHLQSEIEPEGLVDLKRQFARLLGEPLRAGGKLVLPGIEAGELVAPLRRGFDNAGEARFRLRQNYSGAGNRQPFGVRRQAVNVRSVNLREEVRGRNGRNQDGHGNPHDRFLHSTFVVHPSQNPGPSPLTQPTRWLSWNPRKAQCPIRLQQFRKAPRRTSIIGMNYSKGKNASVGLEGKREFGAKGGIEGRIDGPEGLGAVAEGA